MSADLILRLASQLGSPTGNLQLRYRNMVNTPVSSALWLDSGCAVADSYDCVITRSGASYTCTVDCNVKNPYRDMTGKPIVCDGVTPNTSLIPGVSFIFSVSCDTGWTFRASVSQYMDADGLVTPVFGFGVVESGTATAGVRVACVNVGDAPAQQTKIYSLPGGYFYGSGFDQFVKKISAHTNPARHKMAVTGTYSITFADWKSGSGGKKTADVYVNAVKAIEDAIFDGATVYQFGAANGYVDAEDKFKGLFIILADTTADPSAVTLTLKLTADAYTWTEFAPDVTGSPGTYANQDLDLTQAGQSTGTIEAGASAVFWARKNLPDAAQAGDMRKGILRTRGLTT